MDQMWLSSSGTFTLIEFTPYSLWVGLGRSYTHSYQLVFTPYFTETWDGSRVSKMKPCLRQCIFLWVPNWVNEEKMWQYIFVKTGKVNDFWGFKLSLWSAAKEIFTLWGSYKSTWLLVQGESFSSPTPKDSAICTHLLETETKAVTPLSTYGE